MVAKGTGSIYICISSHTNLKNFQLWDPDLAANQALYSHPVLKC